MTDLRIGLGISVTEQAALQFERNFETQTQLRCLRDLSPQNSPGGNLNPPAIGKIRVSYQERGSWKPRQPPGRRPIWLDDHISIAAVPTRQAVPGRGSIGMSVVRR